MSSLGRALTLMRRAVADLFKGLRIADMTWVGVGPFTTKFFADHGADVIKVESIKRPDPLRTMHPAEGGVTGLNRGGYYANRNTGKKSIGVDVTTPEGLDVVKRLVGLSDVLVSNFRPGVMERLGLGYASARALKGDLVFVSMPMFGEEGPYRDFAGYGLVLGAMAGLTGLTRYSDGPPQGTGTNFPDHVPNPIHGALAIMAALIHRHRTGEGQRIEISQLESSVNFIGPALLEAAITGSESSAGAGASEGSAPRGVYPCVGQDEWIAIECESDEMWVALVRVLKLGTEAQSDALLARDARAAARDHIDGWIATATSGWSKSDLAASLQRAGVAAAPVNRVSEVVADSQLARHWAHLPKMDGPGTAIYNRPPLRFDHHEVSLTRAPRLGENTREVCESLLDLSASRVEEYLKRGILVET